MNEADTQRARIFISYKRGVRPDEPIALEVHDALRQHHDVFIDQRDIQIGEDWPKRIEDELSRSDFFIVFLSAESVHSEMVEAEVETAHNLAKQRDGCPKILPIRLAYQEPFPNPLNAYLRRIQWMSWQNDEDTSDLIDKLIRRTSGESLTPEPQPERIIHREAPETVPIPMPSAQLERPEGTMDPQSVYYIKRFSDTIALNTIADQGVTIVIKGPRQVGKSSLLAQVIKAAAEAGKQTVPLDFQLFDRSALTDSATFFRQFCTWIIRRLRIGNQINEYQDADGLGNVLCCTFYMEDLLEKLGRPLLLAMDEVERIFDSDFRSDFFSMLRSWHDSRADTPMKQLDLVLVTSTEPYLFIEQLDQSPFNVGEIIYLEDFKLQAVDDLNRRHGSPLTQDQVRQLIELVGGHPYLVRRALYLLASGRTSVDKLFQSATADRGPFGDHLRRYLFRLYGREDVVQGLKEVIRSKTCQDDIVIHRLEGAGLVRREGQFVVPRCQLYARYFGERLHA